MPIVAPCSPRLRTRAATTTIGGHSTTSTSPSGPLDQQPAFTLQGVNPINVGGTAQADGSLNGVGFGNYDGTSTFVEFSGKVNSYDEFGFFPRGIIGTYVVGPNGELPGGLTTEITTYCVFDPPPHLSDPDDDGIPSIVVVQGLLNLAGTGVLADGQNDLRLRTQVGGVQDITLNNVSDFTVEFQKSGFADAIVERSYNRTWAQFSGTFNPFSFVNVNLPSELGGSVVQSTLSGGYMSYVMSDGTASTIISDYSWSIGQGDPFPLLGGTETSGPWTWNTRTNNAITQYNPLTGAFFANATTELDAKNLLFVPPGAGVEFAGLGDPLLFDESISGVFLPNSVLSLDNCPDDANPDQADSDNDGNGDDCDGLRWADADCGGGPPDSHDALITLLQLADVQVDPFPNCPQLGQQRGDWTGGDWDCDGSVGGHDVLLILEFSGGLAYPETDDCPGAGELVPE